MATYTPQDLFKLWSFQQLSTEMATGHILQNLVTIHETLDTLKRELDEVRANHIGSTTPTRKRNSTSRRT
jgi:hypothetical protein